MRDGVRYDYDTRREVWLALSSGRPQHLAYVVEAVGRHGRVASDEEGDHPKQVEAARTLLGLMYGAAGAVWLTQGISDLLTLTGEEFGFEPWRSAVREPRRWKAAGP